MFDMRRFELMKPASFLINIGRGAVIVLDDLVRALDSQKIAGAALDVFEKEPLPRSSALWSNPKVLITPHVAAPSDAPHVPERRTEILLENCKRFLRGDELLNVVDKKRWF
jgi:phosphoglycerate dehydrogenase-like enzyme